MSAPDEILAAIPATVREVLVACSKAHGLVVRREEDREDDAPRLVLQNGAFEREVRWTCVAYLPGVGSVVGRGYGGPSSGVRGATLEALGYVAEHVPRTLLELASRARRESSHKRQPREAEELLADASRFEAEARALIDTHAAVAAAWPEPATEGSAR